MTMTHQEARSALYAYTADIERAARTPDKLSDAVADGKTGEEIDAMFDDVLGTFDGCEDHLQEIWAILSPDAADYLPPVPELEPHRDLPPRLREDLRPLE
jgi:hypothetical protein